MERPPELMGDIPDAEKIDPLNSPVSEAEMKSAVEALNSKSEIPEAENVDYSNSPVTEVEVKAAIENLHKSLKEGERSLAEGVHALPEEITADEKTARFLVKQEEEYRKRSGGGRKSGSASVPPIKEREDGGGDWDGNRKRDEKEWKGSNRKILTFETKKHFKPCDACGGRGFKFLFFTCKACAGLGKIAIGETQKSSSRTLGV